MSRTRWTLAVVWLWVLSLALPLTAKPGDDAPLKTKAVGDERIYSALDKPVKFDTRELANLNDLARRIREEFDLPVVIHRKNLEEGAIWEDGPINIDANLSGMPLRQVLNNVLRAVSNELTWIVNDEALAITTRITADLSLDLQVYDVTDLCDAEHAPHCNDFMETLTSTIAPLNWNDVGGVGFIKPYRVGGTRALVVTQSRIVHDDIAMLLANLREILQSHAQPGPKAGKKPKPAVDRMETALASPSRLVLEEGMSIEDCIEMVRDKHELSVMIDRQSIHETVRRIDEPIPGTQVDLRGRALGRALHVILREAGLTWVLRDDVLWITTREVADLLLEARVYDMTDLFVDEDPQRSDYFVELITAVVAPVTWSDVGGAGGVRFYQKGDAVALVVNQTADVHAELANLLKALRSLPKRPETPERQSSKKKAETDE
jgi:hypothetical protein